MGQVAGLLPRACHRWSVLWGTNRMVALRAWTGWCQCPVGLVSEGLGHWSRCVEGGHGEHTWRLKVFYVCLIYREVSALYVNRKQLYLCPSLVSAALK